MKTGRKNMRSSIALHAVGLCLVIAGCKASTEQAKVADQPPLASANFEGLKKGSLPDNWMVRPAGYKAELQEKGAPQGTKHMRLSYQQFAPAKFGNFMCKIPADRLGGKTVVFSGKLRAATPGAMAQMWIRVDRSNGQTGGFDNMVDRPVTSDKWQDIEIKMLVDSDASALAFGVMSTNRGVIEFDDLKVEIAK